MDIYEVTIFIDNKQQGRVSFSTKELAEKFIELNEKIMPCEIKNSLKHKRIINEVVDSEDMLMKEFNKHFPEMGI